jgi:hypothetical protein
MTLNLLARNQRLLARTGLVYTAAANASGVTYFSVWVRPEGDAWAGGLRDTGHQFRKCRAMLAPEKIF